MGIALYLFMLFFSIVIFPWWMFRRMKRVKEIMTRKDERPVILRTDETLGAEGGMVYGKAHHIDDDLLAADKAATAMPDIVKTLEGRR